MTTLTLQQQLTSSLPLLAKDGIVWDDRLCSMDLRTKALFFGTGLCTTKSMSAGIPFDFLGFLATAEKIRQICGFKKFIHLIADTHARSNNFVSDEEVDRQAKAFKELSIKVIKSFGIKETDFEVLLASEIDTTKDYETILTRITCDHSQENEYARREWADMEFLAKTRAVCFKLSWTMPLKKKQIHKSDEVFFDTKFKEFFPEQPYSFIYNWAALTFDPDKLNACPYTSAPWDKRILLDANENAEAKLTEFCKGPHKAKEKAKKQIETIIVFLIDNFKIFMGVEGSLGAKVNLIKKIVLKQEEKR